MELVSRVGRRRAARIGGRLGSMVLAGLLAGLVASSCGTPADMTGPMSHRLAAWSSTFGGLSAPVKAIQEDLHQVQLGDGHPAIQMAVCNQLVADLGAAYAYLPSPLPSLTNLLSQAFQSLEAPAQKCALAPSAAWASKTLAAGQTSLAELSRAEALYRAESR